MKRFILFLLILPAGLLLEAQEEKLVQFTGRVYGEFLQPLPYAHILVLNSGRGAITDKEGKFSFVAFEGDTIRFSTLGFKPGIVYIPQNLEEPFLTRDVLLQGDTIMIAEVRYTLGKIMKNLRKLS